VLKKSNTHVVDWKVVEENDPHMMEWMEFFNKWLTLKLHPTYLATKQLQVVVATHKGLMFNWIEFVYGWIHEELVLKKKVKKVASFLCGHSFPIIIQHCLKTPRKINQEENQDQWYCDYF
jgi:hypothetical protein